MILNEIRKTFGKKTFLILLCVMILNGVLLISGESDKGYNFTGEDYRKLYSSEDMQKDTETQLAYLNACLEENGMSRQYFLLKYVISDVEKSADYKGYLQSIADSAEKYGRLSIFMDGDAFSRRNVEKTAAVYASLPEIEPIPGKSRGVVMASRYNGSVMLCFIFVMFTVFLIVTREKEIGSLNLTMTTKYGHVHHGAVKFVMCTIASAGSVLALEAENWIIADIYYGLGDMSRPIQSIPEYQPCIFDISVCGFMLITVASRMLCIIMGASVVFFIACRSRSLTGLAIKLAMVFGAEGVLYYMISGKSIWGLLKYINIYTGLDSQELLGNYMNLNLFGYPVWYLPVFTGFAVAVIIIFTVFSLCAYEKMQSLPGGQKLRLPRLNAGTSSVVIQECYRYFICERVILILMAFAAVRMITFSPVRETFAFQEDIYYKQYMLQLEGMYSEEKEAKIAEEDRKYAEITEKAAEASATTDDVSIRNLIWMKYNDETAHFKVLDKVREQARYLKDKQGAFLYDQGYRILAGEDSGKEADILLALTSGLLMVICSVFMYGPDYQTGTERMIRATRRGRRYLFARREVIGTLTLVIIFGVTYIPYIFSVLNAYGTQGMDFPACSVRCLETYSQWVTIRLYLIGLYLLRYIVLWTGMNLLWYISAKVRSMSYAFGAGLLLCVGGVFLLS